MDQSRPRPQTGKLPLIIDQPRLVSPLKRLVTGFVTLSAWMAWIFMWSPAYSNLLKAWGEHVNLARFLKTQAPSVVALWYLMSLFPLAIGIIFSVLLVNGIISLFYRLLKKPKKRHRVGLEQLAQANALNERKMAPWHAARILQVAHGDHGRVINVTVMQR